MDGRHLDDLAGLAGHAERGEQRARACGRRPRRRLAAGRERRPRAAGEHPHDDRVARVLAGLALRRVYVVTPGAYGPVDRRAAPGVAG